MSATLFLAGDVMLGRGIDQILRHRNAPQLHEPYVLSALDYVRLARRRNGDFEYPVPPQYIWGDALATLTARAPVARIVNLETSITTSSAFDAHKSIHYRMHPLNVDCLTTAGIDCCAVANNHVLDWGRPGLAETLATLDAAGIAHAGAGLDARQAWAPATLTLPGGGRLLIFAVGFASSGIPTGWRAQRRRAGVSLLMRPIHGAVAEIAAAIAPHKRADDVVVASVHWGGNWGYSITDEEVEFAHGLIDDAGVDILHGHSSHHPKGIEIYRGRLILYGCGDLVNDYEGIRGHEWFRGDLGLMYFPMIDLATGEIVDLTLQPVQMRRMRLCLAAPEDIEWLAAVLTEQSRRHASRLSVVGGPEVGSLRAIF